MIQYIILHARCRYRHHTRYSLTECPQYDLTLRGTCNTITKPITIISIYSSNHIVNVTLLHIMLEVEASQTSNQRKPTHHGGNPIYHTLAPKLANRHDPTIAPVFEIFHHK
uniref:Uncharacterized protein n=1 Tax=Anopheles coluzzii TaxID=1518534 RepID=A0A8W7Q0U5_ANOCL